MKGLLFVLIMLSCIPLFAKNSHIENRLLAMAPPVIPPGDTLFFDLSNAVITDGGSTFYYDLPVYINSINPINSFDFWFHFNQSDLTYVSTIPVISQLDTYSNFNINNQFLSNTTSGPSVSYMVPNNTTLIYLRFQLPTACTVIDTSDFNTITTLLNGNVSNYAFIPNEAAQINISNTILCTTVNNTFSFASSYAGSPITSYSWNFSNGASSNQQTANVTFFDPDIYDATLDIQTQGGCTYQFTTNVTVQPSPYVSFTSFNDLVVDSVFFTNLSSPANYSWNFGDNTTSTLTNPAHHYSNGGDYSVTLTATDPGGCSGTYSALVTIDKPIVDFELDSGCVGSAILFTDLSTYVGGSLVGWSWNFGDGNTSTQQNPQHFYATSGVYTVTLTAESNTGIFGSYAQVLSIGNVPVVQFIGDVLIGCSPIDVTFNNTTMADPGSVYQWNFGDNTTSNVISPLHTFQNSGTYSVELIVTTQEGCTDTLLKPDYIQAIPSPIANFSNTGACLNTVMEFTDESINSSGSLVSWNWDFGDGGISAASSASHTFIANGSYFVTLQVANDQGCLGVVSTEILVNDKPIVTFAATNLSGCSPITTDFINSSVSAPNSTYAWEFGDGGISSVNSPSHTYTQNGLMDVQLIVTAPGGCSDSMTRPDYITVFSGVFPAFSDTNRCALTATEFIDETVLSSGNITSWNWNFGDGNSSSVQNPNYIYNNPGVYQVSLNVVSDLGCSGTVSEFVEIDALPIVQFNATDPFGCSPFEVDFLNLSFTEPNSTYSWSFGDDSTAFTPNASHTYNDIGTYTVTLVVSTSEGCVDSLKLTDYIQLQAAPIANFSMSDSIATLPIADVSFKNLSVNYSSLEWNFGDSYFSDLENPDHTFLDSGYFTVCLEAFSSYGCSDTLCKLVHILSSYDIVIPDAFSPNGDDANDLLLVKGGPLKTIQIRIFNEWGNLLFETTDQQNGWDGSFKGTPQPTGSYEYTVIGTTLDYQDVKLYGSIQLTR